MAAARLDGCLLTGDISEADDVAWQLKQLSFELACPLYFVLGNHDFYHGRIERVREQVRGICAHDSRLHYLTGGAPIRVADQWVLCGDDGWADARQGDYFHSSVRMNDFRLIEDLVELDEVSRYRFLRKQGAAAAWRLSNQLKIAAGMARRILVATHVPPFRESCWYDGRHSDDNWAPFFICHSLGWALKRFCQSHPQHEVLVLCGHTHHAGRSRIAENLTVWTGAAEYGVPSLCALLDLPGYRNVANDWTFPSCG